MLRRACALQHHLLARSGATVTQGSRPARQVWLLAPQWAAPLVSRHRCFASSAGGSGSDGKPGDAPVRVEVEVDTKQVDESKAGETKVPAVSTPSEPAVVKESKEPETIENILMRSHRRETLERVGSHAAVRYMPTEDPTAFLLPDSRLEPSERVWQKVFVAVPWMVFALMLTIPLLLVRSNLPFLQKRAEEERRAAEMRNAHFATGRVPEFALVNFPQMPDVLERPFPTLLLLFDRKTFASMIYLPFMRDLEAILRASNINVAVAALDLAAEPMPPDSFLWEYPRALAPHMQLVVPRARDGEAGVIDYKGRWSALDLAEAARELVGPYPPDALVDELAMLDRGLDQLRDALTELLFVDDSNQPSPSALAAEGAKVSWWRRLFGGDGGVKAKQAALAVAEEHRAQAVAQALEKADLSGSVMVALESVREADKELRAKDTARK